MHNRYSVKISHFLNCRIYENISLPSFIPGLLQNSIIDIGDWRMLCHGGCSAPCGSLTAIPGWTHYTSVAPKPCSPHVVINKKVPRHSEMSPRIQDTPGWALLISGDASFVSSSWISCSSSYRSGDSSETCAMNLKHQKGNKKSPDWLAGGQLAQQKVSW